MLDFFLATALGVVTFGAVALFYHHHLWRRLPDPRLEQWALGALMGLGAVLVMLQAVELAPGLWIDSRVLLMGFAGLLAGWRGAVAALLIAVSARLLLGGQGMWIGSTTLTVATLVGLGWRLVETRIPCRATWRYLMFAAVLSLSLSTILLFPEPHRSRALVEALPWLMALNGLGSLVAGLMELSINRSAAYAERLRIKALTDELTGLGNRLCLTEEIDRKLVEINAKGGSFALISLDLDNFRHVNDTLGHKVGDALLIEIAQRLSRSITADDLLVRVAGDQFVVMLRSASANDVIQRAHQLLGVARAPIQLDQYVLLMTASIGVVWSPENGTESRLLLQNAEIAMYKSKHTGRNQVTCFDENMRATLERQASLTQALLHALEDGDGLALVFQPQFDFVTRQLAGAEVLLRWRHAQLGNVGPAEFVPIAEEAGLVRILDQFVMEQAAIQQARWVREGIALKLSVNLSVLSLKVSGIAEEILAVLSRHGVPPTLIEIEVTESADLEGSSEALEAMRSLRAAGITIALDDFGTGHSSLSYLEQLPLDIVKIDRSFVSNIQAGDAHSNSILRAIIALAKALDLKVVAEGVETEEQYDWLAAEGCELAQGYLLGRPTDSVSFKQDYL
jgi:diguanylate cyclase (GGDEF)-like protein